MNCGRGGLIDIDAVHAALQDGRLGGVGLDVFEPEPPEHHPLFDHPDVVLTPHLMGLSRQGTAATFTDAAQGVLDVLAGTRPAAVANPGWDKARPRSADRVKDLLTGKVLLISGGTQGLGAAIARAAAREGAAVVISGRNAERGEKVVAELQNTGAEAQFRAGRRQRRGAGAGLRRRDDRAARADRLPGQRRRV